jgi:hypothetical protein
MRYVSVRVMESNGRPARDARVSIHVSQFLASGSVPDQNTNSEGLTEFELDVDSGADITIYVNGQEKVSRSSIRSDYKVTI